MRKCTNAQMHKSTNAQMRKCSNAQKQKFTNASCDKCAYVQTHDVQFDKYANMFHQHISIYTELKTCL